MVTQSATTFAAVAFLLATAPTRAQPPAEAPPAQTVVRLPGLVADLERRVVDIDATVCLDQGTLEFIACTKGTKEHESIVTVDARPTHIHAALLLLGLRVGHPGMSRRMEGEPPRWEAIPPRGDPVEVSLVLRGVGGDPVEFPIRDFVSPAGQGDDAAPPRARGDAGAPAPFPDVFLFTGSRVEQDEQGNRRYAADESGHVISVATFGDEVLSVPDLQSADNAALLWQINPELLPKVGTRVTLRLRPKPVPAADASP